MFHPRVVEARVFESRRLTKCYYEWTLIVGRGRVIPMVPKTFLTGPLVESGTGSEDSS